MDELSGCSATVASSRAAGPGAGGEDHQTIIRDLHKCVSMFIRNEPENEIYDVIYLAMTYLVFSLFRFGEPDLNPNQQRVASMSH